MFYSKNIISFLLILLFFVNLFDTKTITTTSGVVEGKTIRVLNKNIEEYLGIPYAEPPLGNLRFAKPKPILKPIEGIINTKKWKACLQRDLKLFKPVETNEDCLMLNIWSPQHMKGAKLKPVMFWIHGGALSMSSMNDDLHNGSVYASYDVVFVSLNYRLGYFGFLFGDQESAPGNVGFYDQVLALKWVRNNINLFGGDKNQVTISGQSAGSWSVSAHILSPMSSGLFKRAIMKGGAHMYNKERPVMSKEEALIEAKSLAKRLNCTDEQWLQCLRQIDSSKILANTRIVYYPIDDTDFLPLTAQEAFEQGKFNKDIDLLAGVVKDEGSFLSYLFDLSLAITPINLQINDFYEYMELVNKTYHNLDTEKLSRFYLNNTDINNSTAIRWRIYEFFGHLAMKCPTYLFAKRFSKHTFNETNVYFYEFTHLSSKLNFVLDVGGLDLGVAHGSEVMFTFGHPLVSPNFSSNDIEFSKEVMKLFTDFAKTGKPDKEWPKLVGTDALPNLDLIKDLNPKHNKKFNINIMKDSCNGVWKDYF